MRKTSFLPKSVYMVLTGLSVLLAIPMLIRNEYVLHIFISSFTFAICAMSYDLLVGYTGQASLGHAGLFSIGAYTAAAVSEWYKTSPWIGLMIGCLASTMSSFAISISSTRLRGPFLVISSLAFSEVWRIFVNNYAPLGGVNGIFNYATYENVPTDPFLNKMFYYYLGLVFVVLSGIVIYWIAEHTNVGLAFKTIRENDILAETLGINVFLHKCLAFTISSFFAGLAGGLYAYYVRLVDPSTSMPWVTTLIITMCLTGGRGTVWGSILGALFIGILYESLRAVGIVYNLIAVGFALVVTVLFVPRGLSGILRGK